MSEQVGSKPLKNPRHEQYAQARASELSQAESWKRTIPFGQSYNGGDLSLRVSGNRCEKRPEVKNRILFLRRERAKNSEAVTPFNTDPQSILVLMESVNDALLKASKTAKKHGADRLANMIRQSLTRHVGRQSRVYARLEDTRTTTPNDGEAQKLARKILKLKL